MLFRPDEKKKINIVEHRLLTLTLTFTHYIRVFTFPRLIHKAHSAPFVHSLFIIHQIITTSNLFSPPTTNHLQHSVFQPPTNHTSPSIPVTPPSWLILSRPTSHHPPSPLLLSPAGKASRSGAITLHSRTLILGQCSFGNRRPRRVGYNPPFKKEYKYIFFSAPKSKQIQLSISNADLNRLNDIRKYSIPSYVSRSLNS